MRSENNMRYRPSLFGQDGWIFTKFFFRVLMDRDEVEVHKNAKKDEAAILTEQVWSVKDLLYGQKVTLSISFNTLGNFSVCDFQNQP